MFVILCAEEANIKVPGLAFHMLHAKLVGSLCREFKFTVLTSGPSPNQLCLSPEAMQANQI